MNCQLRYWKRSGHLFMAVFLFFIFSCAASVQAKPALNVDTLTNAKNYTVGEKVTVLVKVKDKKNRRIAKKNIKSVRLIIKDGDNEKVKNTKLKYVKKGVYRYRFTLDEETDPGTWKVKALVKDKKGRKAADGAKFYVASNESEDEEEHQENNEEQEKTEVITAHSSIAEWQGTATCLACHRKEAEEVHGSAHYQWIGPSPYMNEGPAKQGKLEMGVNSYCINIKGNWNGCGSCHVGLGARPETTVSEQQLENIDCLVCHQSGYKRKKENGVFVADLANMTINMVEAAQTVHLPRRDNCLQCHAKGGGGDNFKRGDLALAHIATTDKNFDVHMATSEANLNCQACHISKDHLIAGKGSDLRITELDVNMDCIRCHGEQGRDHESYELNTHLTKVACQTCHIPMYAKNASDTAATEKTEIYRTWLEPHPTASGAIHPTPTLAGNLVPEYRWWNKYSTNYLLFDQAIVDPETGRVPTSRPDGAVNDPLAKLYPFKYKAALQPLATAQNELIALDTSIYFTTGDADAATKAGLVNMGYAASDAYEWVETDTFQLITHEVAPDDSALSCADCHESNRMDFKALGYGLKAAPSVVCIQCHGEEEDDKSFSDLHNKHVKDKKYDCSWCHSFSRPERGLKMP